MSTEQEAFDALVRDFTEGPVGPAMEWAITVGRTADSDADFEECDSMEDAYRKLRLLYRGLPARVVYRTVGYWRVDG